MSKYIRIGVSVGLLAIIAWRMDWSGLADKFVNLRLEYWLAAVGVLILSQVCSAKRWQIFARELRFQQTLPQYCAYYFIGMYFNLSLPTSVGGDVVRVWYLNGNSGRKWAALASVFLDRMNGLLVLIAMACVGVLIAPIDLPSWILIAVGSVAGGACLALLSLPLLQRWKKVPLHRRQQLQTLLHLARVPKVLAGATLMSIFVQFIGVVCLWLVGLSLGLDVPLAYYCILCPMVSLLTLLPSINGMGLRELGMVVFLTPWNIDETTATTLGVLWFAVSMAVSLMGGMVYLFGAYPKANSEGTSDDGSVDRDSDQGREGELKAVA